MNEMYGVLGRWQLDVKAETSVQFLKQLRQKHTEPLVVIWDNGPAHHGPEIREYLTTPDLKLRLVALPGYSPDFNPDEAIWDWIREDVTANTCFDKAAVKTILCQTTRGRTHSVAPHSG